MTFTLAAAADVTGFMLQLDSKLMCEQLAEHILDAVRQSSKDWNEEIRTEKPQTKPSEDFELRVRTDLSDNTNTLMQT